MIAAGYTTRGEIDMVKEVGNIEFTDVVTGKLEKYFIIEIEEETKVQFESFMANHRYWVLEGRDITDFDEYMEPLNDPDYNLKRDFQKYRKQYNFLSPEAISNYRKQLGLNLREAALILAMSFSTLSNIENGLILQSYDQEIKLRDLENPFRIFDKVDKYRTLLEQRALKRNVDIDKLLKKLEDKKLNEEKILDHSSTMKISLDVGIDSVGTTRIDKNGAFTVSDAKAAYILNNEKKVTKGSAPLEKGGETVWENKKKSTLNW
ncbi:helix-turn-helix domain-containing protein [Secundilactobacillus malefermentans DSM 5705 = KCTC 3548]|nr:helix-turn-helix domain-containing protein [Secundilactobacillus malefermentans DSM 5705 = KCTC 3548]